MSIRFSYIINTRSGAVRYFVNGRFASRTGYCAAESRCVRFDTFSVREILNGVWRYGKYGYTR